ncbi:MAG: hypothetical protein V1799_03900 [bacterium]
MTRTLLNKVFLGILIGLLSMDTACKKTESNPVTSENDLPTANLFPWSPGRLFVYSAYDLDTTNSQKVSSSVHKEVTYVQSTANYQGKNALRLIDSIYSPSGTLTTIDTAYIALESIDLYGWNSGWVALCKRSAGLNIEYDAGQVQEIVMGITLTLNAKGKIYPKEDVSVPIGTMKAFKSEFRINVNIAGIAIDALSYFYFADGYGLVKSTTPPPRDPLTGKKTVGTELILVSKNF